MIGIERQGLKSKLTNVFLHQSLTILDVQEAASITQEAQELAKEMVR